MSIMSVQLSNTLYKEVWCSRVHQKPLNIAYESILVPTSKNIPCLGALVHPHIHYSVFLCRRLGRSHIWHIGCLGAAVPLFALLKDDEILLLAYSWENGLLSRRSLARRVTKSYIWHMVGRMGYGMEDCLVEGWQKDIFGVWLGDWGVGTKDNERLHLAYVFCVDWAVLSMHNKVQLVIGLLLGSSLSHDDTLHGSSTPFPAIWLGVPDVDTRFVCRYITKLRYGRGRMSHRRVQYTIELLISLFVLLFTSEVPELKTSLWCR